MFRNVHCLLGTLALLLVVPAAATADWPQFRGPGGGGAAPAAAQFPAQWDLERDLVWRAELPGPGGSSPIVLGDRVYLTCYSGYGISQERPGEQESLRRHILCFQLSDGKLVWSRTATAKVPETNYQGFQALHGYASSTPATDGERLYVFFGRSGAGALTLDGEPLWTRSLGTDTHSWGSATSPVVYNDLVIFNASVESGQLVALDKRTGEVVWRAGNISRSWATPCLVATDAGDTELVLSIENEIIGFDPATGERLWRCDGIRDYICPSVIAHDGVAYAIAGRSATAVAVRVGGRGDVTQTHRLWAINKGSNVSSPVYHDGHLYWVHESRGTAYCVEAESGEVVYEERLEPRPGRIYASPVLADGKLFVVTREDGVFVLAAKPQFQLLAHNAPLDESIFNGSPAVSGGKLLLRSDQYLYCIGR